MCSKGSCLTPAIILHAPSVVLVGIYGVGKAAENPPALAVLSHTPEGATQTIAWVGKGIVYDTGGLSIKGKVRFLFLFFSLLFKRYVFCHMYRGRSPNNINLSNALEVLTEE